MLERVGLLHVSSVKLYLLLHSTTWHHKHSAEPPEKGGTADDVLLTAAKEDQLVKDNNNELLPNVFNCCPGHEEALQLRSCDLPTIHA